MTPEKKPDSRKSEGRKVEKKAEKQTEERPRARLDQPLELRRNVVGRTVARRAPDNDRFGRFAEQFARFMGTARFLIYMTLFVLVWVGWNAVAPSGAKFDDYPFIFLTLMLSLQASYAAPLILLAQNRQEVRDRVVTEQDRQANARAHADMEFLAREVASLRMALGEVATRDFLRSELRSLLAELDLRDSDPDDEGEQDHRSGTDQPGAGQS
ncbi:MAG: hypothetical protein JWP74_2458 [Marmoricola sp.]|nr:hypothetical protein [Marmoricola sp.]